MQVMLSYDNVAVLRVTSTHVARYNMEADAMA